MQIDISQCPPSIRDRYVSSEPFSPLLAACHLHGYSNDTYSCTSTRSIQSSFRRANTIMSCLPSRTPCCVKGLGVVVGVRKEQIICHPPKRNKRTKIFKRLLGSHSAFMAPTFARSSGSRVHIASSLFLAKLKTRIIRPGMHYVMTCYIDAPASTLFSAGIKGREPS